MESTDTPKIQAGGYHYWLRVLNPLVWWCLFVLTLYGLRTHQRWMEKTRIQFSVTMNGTQLFGATAQLDGRPIYPGGNIPLGSHIFFVTTPKGEPFQTNFFAWYGPHNLGEIKLRRKMGTLNVQSQPLAGELTIKGPEFERIITNFVATSLVVPTDQYEIDSQYRRASQSKTILVADGQTSTCSFTQPMGAIVLTCNESDSKYQLATTAGQVLEEGNFPATITELLAGAYEVTAYYHNRKVQKSVIVTDRSTEKTSFEFLLGALRFESEPAGATVNGPDGRVWGQTPFELTDLTPLTSNFTFSKAGYESTSMTATIIADQTNAVRATLVSSSYVGAMRKAREFLRAGNYQGAFQASAEALNAKPNDADALAIQLEAKTHLTVEQQRLERIKRPREIFNALCDTTPDSKLFERHEITTTKSAEEVEGAIAKSLTNQPEGFKMLSDKPLPPDVFEIVGQHVLSLGILGGFERDCLIVVGRTSDTETIILYRVAEYQIEHGLEGTSLFNIKGSTTKVPLHASRMQMNDALSKHVRDGERIVTERIQQAVR